MTELIPLNELFGNPVKSSPQISPDGTMLAYLAPLNGVMNVWVGQAGSEEYRAVTNDTDRGIQHFFWAADNRHLIYAQDVGGDENWHIHRGDIDGTEVLDMTPFEGVQAFPLTHNKHFPDEMLVAMNRENPQLMDVWRLRISTGELQPVAKNPGAVIGWMADTQLQVRAALQATPDGGRELIVRDTPEGEWRTLGRWDAENALGSHPVTFTADGRSLLFIDSNDANAGRLVRIDIATGARVVIAEDAQYDVGDVVIHPDTYEVQMVAFIRARTEWTVLDESIREDIDAIRALQEGDFEIVSRDDADTTWLVGFVVDDGPVSFYIYDRSSKSGRLLFDSRPELRNYTLAPMEPISFTARDGLTIHGYITFPVGVERKNLPMVLNVHGGPWVRDTWGFRGEVQWLANRGYICLQVNYRGSTGYGKDFLNAGNKQWSRAMHDDLVDAVKWAVDQGYADPERVAIYGGSYGGYAALVGATFTPDLFRCAVDIVGPSNLLTFIESIPPYWAPIVSQFHDRVGDPETDRDLLIDCSPIFKVDRIKIPMLIVQGANDPRVKQAESEQIVAAMKEKGIEHTYLLFPDEGHGFAKPENRMKFYGEAEKFLARQLGGRVES